MVAREFVRRVACFGATLGSVLGFTSAASAQNERAPLVAVREGHIYLTPACDARDAGTAACAEQDVAALPKDVGGAKVRTLAVGGANGGVLFHVLATEKEGARSWEALVVPRRSSPVLFSDYTGFAPGTVGDRVGTAIDIREGAPATVLVGELAERASLCGQGLPLLRPKVYLPKIGELAPVSMHRLSEAVRARAIQVNAVRPAPEDPNASARILDLGQSSDGARAEALLDENPATHWSETKKGDGHGEFVSFRVATAVPLERVVLTIPGEDKERALRSPKSVYVATDAGVFRVVFPKSSEKQSGSFVAAFPSPQKTSCLAVTLDEAFSTPTPTTTQMAVSLSEISVTTALDTRSARDLAADLDGSPLEADAVAAYLERVQSKKLGEALSHYDSLGPGGRTRALSMALGRAGCDAQGAFLVERMSDADKQVRERARAKLERCGKGATEVLLAGLSTPSGGEAAGLLALVAPSRAILPLQAAMANVPVAARGPYRSALSRALRIATPDVLTQLLQSATGSPAEVDVLRAAAPRLPEVFDAASTSILRVLGATAAAPTWETRYVLAPALLELVRIAPKGSAVMLAFEDLLTKDSADPVRARAAELAASVPLLRVSLEGALKDRSPRVRREAALSLGKLGANHAAAQLLSDPWPFVRAEALLTLKDAKAPSQALVASVAKSLKDDSPAVRAAAILALGKFRAVAHREALVGILYDDDEMSDVRILAARGLGEMCSRDDTDRLTKLARASASPVQSQLERDVAFAAIEALGDLHPADLKDRLAPLLAMGPKAQARAAAERALASKGACP